MALLKDIEQFKKHVAVNSSMDFEDVLPDILLVENEQIVKLLGRAFYDELEAVAYSELSEAKQKLVDMLNYSTAHLAEAEYLDLNQVNISSSGVHLTGKTAFQWQINQIKASFRRKGFNGIERALEYLESKIDEEEFSTWAESTAVTVFRQYFINSAREFQEHYHINTSRLTYLSLLPIIKKSERNDIMPFLGEEFYEELKEQIKDRDVTPENQVLLDRYICPALAHMVAAKALTEQTFQLTADGIEITYARMDDSNSKEAEADNSNLLSMKIKEAWQEGQSFLVRMKRFLNKTATATKYATYFNSELYVNSADDAPVVYRNPSDTKTFAFI